MASVHAAIIEFVERQGWHAHFSVNVRAVTLRYKPEEFARSGGVTNGQRGCIERH
jgi:hypothetical protein